MDDNTRRVMHSSANIHYNTPYNILTAIYKEWGGIELDPCSNKSSLVLSRNSFSGPDIDVDGLKKQWVRAATSNLGNYVNPPYGRKLRLWTKKCVDEATHGAEIVLLGPARVETKFFQEDVATAAAILFIKGRLTFVGAKHPAPFPSFLAYWGPRKQKFFNAFLTYGIFWSP